MEKELLTIPVWLSAVMPSSWIATLPLSYVYVTFALLISLRIANRKNGDFSDTTGLRRFAKKFAAQFEAYKASIWRTWLTGLAIWLAGTFLMLAPSMISINTGNKSAWLLGVSDAVLANPFANPIALLWVIICVAACAALIFLANNRFCTRKTNLGPKERASTAIFIALFTAPYIFLIPYHIIA